MHGITKALNIDFPCIVKRGLSTESQKTCEESSARMLTKCALNSPLVCVARILKQRFSCDGILLLYNNSGFANSEFLATLKCGLADGHRCRHLQINVPTYKCGHLHINVSAYKCGHLQMDTDWIRFVEMCTN